jgi:hypothetical protein
LGANFAQSSTLDEFADDVMRDFTLADFVYDQDVRMVQSRGGFGFADEAREVCPIISKFVVQGFDCDVTTKR